MCEGGRSKGGVGVGCSGIDGGPAHLIRHINALHSIQHLATLCGSGTTTTCLAAKWDPPNPTSQVAAGSRRSNSTLYSARPHPASTISLTGGTWCWGAGGSVQSLRLPRGRVCGNKIPSAKMHVRREIQESKLACLRNKRKLSTPRRSIHSLRTYDSLYMPHA